MGRAIVDVYGDQVGAALEDVSSFSRYVGGCPANIAIGTARLGIRVGMITRVGDDHNGRFLKRSLAAEGVDTHCVVADPERLTGVAFLAIRDKETFPLLHYRENCADIAISPEDYTEGDIAGAGALLISGSHLTTPAAAANLACAVERAVAGGTRLIFDIDYRPVFWGLVAKDGGASRFVDSATVTAASQRFLPHCDLIVGTEEEVHIAGGDTDTIAALRTIRQLSRAPIVVKRGSAGCVVFPGAIPDLLDEGLVGPGFLVEVFNVVGAGDGFLSGFLSGWLRGMAWSECCRRGNATGALVVSRHGCSPASPTSAELDWFLQGGQTDPALHRSAELAYLHRTTTRLSRPDPVLIMAADHMAPFEALPCIPTRSIPRFKSLVAEAALALAPNHPQLGVLFDDVAGEDALFKIGNAVGWVGRKIERTGSAPLALSEGKPAGVLLASWPRYQIIKCLVPVETDSTRALQDERLRELGAAAAMYGIELLLELVHPDEPGEAEAVARRIRDIQGLGVRPDWWKLPAFSDGAGWAAIESAIVDGNPMCRGVLLLGGGRSGADLSAAMRPARGCKSVCGFAVGRTLFLEPAQAWLSGKIDDDALVERVKSRYAELVQAWHAAAPGASAHAV